MVRDTNKLLPAQWGDNREQQIANACEQLVPISEIRVDLCMRTLFDHQPGTGSRVD